MLSPEILREKFLDWQCQSRVQAFRVQGGKPNSSMSPMLLDKKGNELNKVIVVITESDPVNTTKMFEHTYKQTYDPATRFDKMKKFLSSDYFLDRHKFSDSLFATFPIDSTIQKKIIKDGTCYLDFLHLSTNYKLKCSPFKLDRDEDHWENIFWHNKNFNPGLGNDIDIIKFIPDWKKSELIRITD
ncbi:MAG: hypothetical protein CMI90_03825 [Pelagibacteraceae bacterium]|nr:hypothetical protein [Pelagibacteraceae bacterium]|tara:strand:+ start:656 stop:1213 length:558 start_codon:yes stop_codon:yes gene_type:complete